MKILKYAYVSSVQIPPFKIIHFSSREVSRSQHNWEEARVPRGQLLTLQKAIAVVVGTDLGPALQRATQARITVGARASCSLGAKMQASVSRCHHGGGPGSPTQPVLSCSSSHPSIPRSPVLSLCSASMALPFPGCQRLRSCGRELDRLAFLTSVHTGILPMAFHSLALISFWNLMMCHPHGWIIALSCTQLLKDTLVPSMLGYFTNTPALGVDPLQAPASH